ncbi:MAG: Zn-ribbon domain-containing OB-fold protein [Promethearchaeota archaeon]
MKWLGKNTTLTQTKLQDFFKQLENGKLCAGICQSCGKKHYPPRSGCSECFSKNIELIPLPKEGNLVAFSQIHYGPTAFLADIPYIIGILELEEDLRVMGWVKEIPVEKLQVGMNLVWHLEPGESDNYLLFLNQLK